MDCISDWYSYFNSRGYASVFCGGLGTRGSQGFNCCGSPEETAAFKAVIDWLNGRCRAFTNLTDNIEIRADWCTGKVAMSGKSYLGTMCIAVASTGVEGLETIIPEAAISNWYDYYRCNGLNLPSAGRATTWTFWPNTASAVPRTRRTMRPFGRRMPPGWRELRQMRTGTAATTAAGGTCAIT